MIVICAKLQARPGKEEELISEMKALVDAVKKNEPDTMEYTFHRSRSDPRQFLVYEKYKSNEAMQAHMSSAHFQEAGKKLGGLVLGAPALETYEVIE